MARCRSSAPVPTTTRGARRAFLRETQPDRLRREHGLRRDARRGVGREGRAVSVAERSITTSERRLRAGRTVAGPGAAARAAALPPAMLLPWWMVPSQHQIAVDVSTEMGRVPSFRRPFPVNATAHQIAVAVGEPLGEPRLPSAAPGSVENVLRRASARCEITARVAR